MIVLDTNVVADAMNPKPSAQVLSWMASYPREVLFITTVTEAEILYGVALLPAGKRRTALQADVDSMLNIEFADRILPFDEQAARAFSQIAAKRRSCGRPIGDLDAQIVAIAFSRRSEEHTSELQSLRHL